MIKPGIVVCACNPSTPEQSDEEELKTSQVYKQVGRESESIECLLLFQRTLVQFPAPKLVNSQPSVTPTPGASTRMTYIYTHKNESKTFLKFF